MEDALKRTLAKELKSFAKWLLIGVILAAIVWLLGWLGQAYWGWYWIDDDWFEEIIPVLLILLPVWVYLFRGLKFLAAWVKKWGN